MKEDNHKNNFILLGTSQDNTYHFIVKYTFTYKEIKIEDNMYYFSNFVQIISKDVQIMASLAYQHVRYHYNIEVPKGVSFQMSVSYDKVGKLGFKEVDKNFLKRLPIYVNSIFH
jgi:hypothetical protein